MTEDIALTALTETHLALIIDASVCHRWAGALTVIRAIASDSLTPGPFEAHIDQLTRHVATDLARLPRPGFLEGRAGAQLVLDGTNTTGWTRVLLID